MNEKIGSIYILQNPIRLKENQIYAYGILDGFNNTWIVDLIEQCLLTNMYFDHLPKLESNLINLQNFSNVLINIINT